jgi:hypothetical protein
MAKKTAIRWLDEPNTLNYPEALSYLSLVFKPKTAASYLEKLRGARVVKFKAKDIFRASGLSLLGISNSHVERDRRKIVRGTPLSPVLLVRYPELGKVVVADGYHRLCAVYSFAEDAIIPCKIV